MKQIYICNDTITGIYSALYDAWKKVGIKRRELTSAEKHSSGFFASIPLWRRMKGRHFSWNGW